MHQVLGELYQRENARLRRELHQHGVTHLTFDAWIKAQPSSRLRGTLYRAVEDCDYRIFLDHFPPLTPATARVIKELFWMRGTPVYLIPSGMAESETVKATHHFYWGREELMTLGPLPLQAASKLLEECIKHFNLTGLELDGVREEFLELSHRIPGAIVMMCSLAADKRYHWGMRIKTKLVYSDYIASCPSATLYSRQWP